MTWAWRIGSVFGIPVRLHVTMLIFPYIAFSWVSGTGPAAIVAAAALSVLLFGSILLHELGHALTARRFGIRTLDIVLTPIGGMARVVDMPQNPRQEILIAVAGPLVSLAIAAAAFTTGLTLSIVPLVPAVVHEGLGILVWINAMLGLFNLVPALPMDGGRVLRGYLALKRDHLTATRIAARVGRVIAIAGGAIAVLYLHSISLALIAVFVYLAAGSEVRAAEIREARRRAAAEGGGFDPGARGPWKTWTWSWGAGPRPGPSPRGPRDRDVVVVEGGKVEVISRRDPDDE